MRIQKYLAHCGVCSRREAERRIEEGRVYVNGKPARMGQKVTEQDAIRIDTSDIDFDQSFALLKRTILEHI